MRRNAGGLMGLALAAVVTAAGSVPAVLRAGEAAAPDQAERDRRDREAALALKQKARERGEKVDWDEFVPDVTPGQQAAYEHFLAWGDCYDRRQGMLNEPAGRAAWDILYGAVPVEQFQIRLAALEVSPLAVEARLFAGLDRCLADTPPRLAFRRDEQNPAGILLPHWHTCRAAVRLLAARARCRTTAEGGDAGLAALERGLALDGFFADEPFLISQLVRLAVRTIFWSTTVDVCLLDPPSPAALRRWADRVEKTPSLAADMERCLQFDRAGFERIFFLDPELTVPNPRWNEVPAEGLFDLQALGLPNDEAGRRAIEATLFRAPAMRPQRNLRVAYQAWERLLGDPAKGGDFAEWMGGLGRRIADEVRRLQAEADRAKRPLDLSTLGADDDDAALFVAMYMPALQRARLMTYREDAHRQVLAFALRQLADRQEGRPYRLDDRPVSPFTGQPYAVERRDGLLYLHVFEDKVSVRLPLVPGDEGYDPAKPWRFGHEPVAAPVAPEAPPAVNPPLPVDPPAPAEPEIF